MAQEIADSTLLDTWGSGGNIVEPDISKIIEGWQLGEQPPHEYMNWLQNTFGSKLNHILKNGIASWNNENEYLAGATVQHTGNVWLCKTTNTDSAPTDANANWKRIITVEALSGYVALTGNQTIAGVKTFSSSPIVPTPTTGTQAVNKKYVDDSAIGVGQTWQDVKASRVTGVTYTNTTGRTIAVKILVRAIAAGNTTTSLKVNGDDFSEGTSTVTNETIIHEAILPSGDTYMLPTVGNTTIHKWMELR